MKLIKQLLLLATLGLIGGLLVGGDADAAAIKGEILRIEPPQPKWGDTIAVHFESNHESRHVDLDCYEPGTNVLIHHSEPASLIFDGDPDGNGVQNLHKNVTLQISPSPRSADCVFTLWGYRWHGSNIAVMDEFLFHVTAT